MKILVLGANGMIGARLVSALTDAGHDVTGSGRRPDAAGQAGQELPATPWLRIDFASFRRPEQWHALLEGMALVINAVGLFSERYPGEFDDVHRAAPQALFKACHDKGCALIHLSALGSDAQAQSAYWRSKGQAEEALMACGMEATILRPSLVFGPEGASSKMLMSLATLPLVMLPAAHVPVRPVHVEDVAALVTRLVAMREQEQPWPSRIDVAGPCPLTLGAYVALLGKGLGLGFGLGRQGCRIWNLPLNVAGLLARGASLLRLPLLTPDAIAMLQGSLDGRLCPDATAMAGLLGRSARHPASFATPAMRSERVMAWAYPALTIAIAMLWLITAWVSWFAWPHVESHAWLAACGIPPALRETTLAAASLTDAAIGIALLAGLACQRRGHALLWPLQALLVLVYTLVMSTCLPAFWAHPFGPLSKNLPLLMLFFAMWRLR